MKSLKDDIQGFLHDNQLPDALTNVNANWAHFHLLLINILTEQPIITRRHPIKRFCYEIDHKDGHPKASIECDVESKRLILTFGL
jgi:hypothetical protein